jgi:hypothetical protein
MGAKTTELVQLALKAFGEPRLGRSLSGEKNPQPEFVGRILPARFALAPSALDLVYWLYPQRAAVSRGYR